MIPKKVILHCSDTVDGVHCDIVDIDRWHRERGMKSCGYQFVILPDGTLQTGRGMEELGAHTRGYNLGSIGICLIGRNQFTEQQLETLIGLGFRIYNKYKILPEDWHGHYEFSDKTCPNFPVDWVKYLLERSFNELGLI